MSQHVTDPDSWIADPLTAPQQKFARFAERVYEGDALSRRTKELIAVATSTMLRCRHCTRSHIEAALEHGATKAGVAEALGVAWVIGSGTQVVWHEDGFNEHLHDGSA
jgi:AhpD family alkylhydroperoxidase